MFKTIAIGRFGGPRIYVLVGSLLVMVAASQASAQTSSSNCMALGGGLVHCNTTTMGGGRGYNEDGGAALGRGIASLITRNRERSLRKRIGKLLADGDCQGAANYAYQKGRLELGAAIADACVRR